MRSSSLNIIKIFQNKRNLIVGVAVVFAICLLSIGASFLLTGNNQEKATNTSNDVFACQNSTDGYVAMSGYSIKEQIQDATNTNSDDLVDTNKRVRIKSTIVENSSFKDGDNIDSLMGTIESAGTSLLAQTETTATLYDYGNDDCYVAYLNNVDKSGFVDSGVKDIAFARDNYNGEVVEGISYHSDSGIVYVPKELVDDYEPNDSSAEQGNVMQAQLLYTADRQNAGDVFFQSATLENENTGDSIDTYIGGELWDGYSYIQVTSAENASNIDANDISVSVNDNAIGKDADTNTEVSYNNKTGWLRISNNVLGVGNAKVTVNSATTAKLESSNMATLSATISSLSYIKERNNNEIKFCSGFDIASLSSAF